MLYVTTRSKDNPQTAYKALTETGTPDGGLYLPMRINRLSDEVLTSLGEKTFAEVVAEILNLFFSTQLTGWDVEFSVGRYPVRRIMMSHRMMLTETWHNPDWDFARTVQDLTALISGNAVEQPGDWGAVAIRIAVLFGVFAELMAGGEIDTEEKVDISVPSGDFSAPMAAVHARQMGLPIGNVVVCCNENCAPWDLVCKGELKTGTVAISTALSECDHVIPRGIERFLHACGGESAVGDYLSRAGQGGVYFPDPETFSNLRSMLQVSVVSSKRILSSLRNIYKTTGKILSPYTALTWCGLMDYRARTGESRLSLVISERSPQVDAAVVAEAMGMRQEELIKIL